MLTMDGNSLECLNRHWGVFKQLSNREPTTAIEARAVVENIRAEKGHLDDQALQEVNTLSVPVRETLLRIVELKRETEAAYTTKYGVSPTTRPVTESLIVFLSNYTPPNTAFSTSWCRMRTIRRIRTV
jgi:hypothetical protein